MRRWIPAVVMGCTCASMLTALFWGWVSVWFQLGGSVAARDDYLVATGAYGSGAVIAAAGVLAMYRWEARGRVVLVVGLGSALLLLLAIRSALTAGSTPSDGFSVDSWPTGVTLVLMWPWTWLPLVAAPLAVAGLGGPRPTRSRTATEDPA